MNNYVKKNENSFKKRNSVIKLEIDRLKELYTYYFIIELKHRCVNIITVLYLYLICTYSKFKAGDGDLELFCTEADELHKTLLSCPRPLPRIATTPLPPTPKEKQKSSNWSDSPSMTPPRCLLESRRMSRSEGDLKKFVLQQPPLLRSAGSQQHLILLPQNNLMQKVSSHNNNYKVSANIGTDGQCHCSNNFSKYIHNGMKNSDNDKCTIIIDIFQLCR